MPAILVADLNAQTLETDTILSASFQRYTYKCLYNTVTDLKHNLCPINFFSPFCGMRNLHSVEKSRRK